MRSDYMLDMPTKSVKLVEYNTIAVGCGLTSHSVAENHDYIMQKYGSMLETRYLDPITKKIP
jgi:hypothetical protein